MSQPYFSQLPLLIYNNTLCKDITRRVTLVEQPETSPYIFYPYEIKHNLRSDAISEYYYNDSQLDWFIYLSNQIIDPYYEWYMDDRKLNDSISIKYGSVETAIKKIKYYKTNWESDYKEISVSYYNNNIDPSWKKYYDPVFGVANKITSYSRKKEDATINTNRILKYTISANNNLNSFVLGEIVDIRVTGTNTVATAEFVSSNSSSLIVKNVSGNTFANSSVTRYIIGEDSGANITVNAVSTIIENITEEEEVFWSPVTYYDYEVEINEQRKTIRLVGDALSDSVVGQFINRIREDVDPTTNMTMD